MSGPTERDVFDHLFGSGATSYSWYREVVQENDAAKAAWGSGFDEDITGWEFVMNMENPRGPGNIAVLFNAKSMIRRMEWIRDGEINDRYMNQSTKREVLWLLSDPDHADLDANAADEVIQNYAYGEVVFG